MKNFLPIIGLEIHVELKTKSKMFCQCAADYFKKEPNTQICPVCLGFPGVLPVPNRKAIEATILIGKTLHCQINQISHFDRKHYFYPDLPKGYQISQDDLPFCVNGYLDLYPQTYQEKITSSVFEKICQRFRIRRVHLEEDTGKLIHEGDKTLIDFNRSGVPLVEIVTEPDFHDGESVKRFLEELQVIIRYLGVSDCDMEKGTMRLEPNISIKIQNENNELPDYKVEIKNINSFRYVKEAIDYEIERQISLLKKGIKPKQETRGYDEKKGITFSQREKEEAYDYRYFPEPDIPPIIFSQEEINSIKIPDLPLSLMKKLIFQMGIRYQDAFILTRNKETIEFFEKLLAKVKSKFSQKEEKLAQKIANLIINKKIEINHQNIEKIAEEVCLLLQPKTSDKNILMRLIEEVINENKKAVEDYKKGKRNAIMFLVGMVMKKGGKGLDAQLVRKELEKILN